MSCCTKPKTGTKPATEPKARTESAKSATTESLCSRTVTLHINWSNFKPEFSSKPEEDAEAHLLCSNDLMNAHHFLEDVKVQRFCLTLLVGARLWFQSKEPLEL